MKILNRKNKGFASCMPDLFLGVVFVAVSGIVIYYAFSQQQEKMLAKQAMTKIITKDKVEIKKQ